MPWHPCKISHQSLQVLQHPTSLRPSRLRERRVLPRCAKPASTAPLSSYLSSNDTSAACLKPLSTAVMVCDMDTEDVRSSAAACLCSSCKPLERAAPSLQLELQPQAKDRFLSASSPSHGIACSCRLLEQHDLSGAGELCFLRQVTIRIHAYSMKQAERRPHLVRTLSAAEV